jgi:short-subunit dehydrogenase
VNLIVVGASAGLGRALADRLASKGHNLLLVASSSADLEALSADLQIRNRVKVDKAAVRLGCDQESVQKVLESVQAFGNIDGVFFPIGYSRDDDDGTLPAQEIERIAASNLGAIMALCSAILPDMLKQRQGFLVFFGSVAAERGRSSNIVYAAAKRGLQSFAESMRHRCAPHGVTVQYYQLGYLNTAQTFGKKLPFPAAEPEQAAAFIVDRIGRDFGQCYFPWFWRYICLALRMTPWSIFKKLKF